MPDDAQPHRGLIAKIGALPPQQVAEVEAFVDALREADTDRARLEAAQVGSHAAFAAAWDNSDDALYDGL